MILTNEAQQAKAQLILAHGAGAGKQSDFMQFMAEALSRCHITVHRFNFAYMQQALDTGKKRPPGAAKKLLGEYQDVIQQCASRALPLFIGGKSMGGRIASMLLEQSPAVAGICLGYPYHPPGKPDNLRVEHLLSLSKPLLVVQGQRDTFGTQQQISTYGLPQNINQHFLTDGDHSFKPRKASGLTLEQNMQQAVSACDGFISSVLEETSE